MRTTKGLHYGLICCFLLAIWILASTAVAAEGDTRGTVAETMDSGGYTYILLERDGKKEWFAIPESLVRVGDEVQLMPGVQMGEYTSPTLKRTFEQITFSGGINGMLKRVVKNSEDTASSQESIKVAKAEGKDAYTVAEIFEKRQALNGKKAVVRGKVVKSSQFDGQQWLRIVDGTGTSKRGDHKLVVTSSQNADKDDIVTAAGTVVVDKAFGALTYEVVLDQATIEKQAK